VSIITGLDFPLERETGTWDWKVRLKVVQDRTEAPRSIYSLNYLLHGLLRQLYPGLVEVRDTCIFNNKLSAETINFQQSHIIYASTKAGVSFLPK